MHLTGPLARLISKKNPNLRLQTVRGKWFINSRLYINNWRFKPSKFAKFKIIGKAKLGRSFLFLLTKLKRGHVRTPNFLPIDLILHLYGLPGPPFLVMRGLCLAAAKTTPTHYVIVGLIMLIWVLNYKNPIFAISGT